MTKFAVKNPVTILVLAAMLPFAPAMSVVSLPRGELSLAMLAAVVGMAALPSGVCFGVVLLVVAGFLHGLAREDAWLRLESFFADACRRRLEKVLIIHGKGTHSAEDPVLGPMVKLFLERNRHAGESGHSGRELGGTGSTWVILK